MSSPLPAAFRDRASGTPVTPFELFFDLVFVFAVTRLSQHLLEHLTVAGAAKTLLLTLAVYSAWIYTSWVTNRLDPEHPAVRLTLIGVMLAGLVMAAALPEAFENEGLWFAGALVAVQVGRHVVLVALARGHAQARNFLRILLWLGASGVLWIAGGLLHGTARIALWAAATVVDWAAPWIGYPVPRLGRSGPQDWDIDGTHMAERCRLFIIIALGESIVVTGATFTGLGRDAATVAALAVAFLGTVAMWWIYFDRTAEAAATAIAATRNPGALARSAYTYMHIPIVAGVIVAAVGDELVIAHPGGSTPGGTAAVVLGGPALFILGHGLFKRAVFGSFTRLRLVALTSLALLVPLYPVLSPLTLATLAALVMIWLALYDSLYGDAPAGAGR